MQLTKPMEVILKSFLFALVALTIAGGVGLTSNAPTFDDAAVAVPIVAEMLATQLDVETVHRRNHQSHIGAWGVSGRTGPDGILTNDEIAFGLRYDPHKWTPSTFAEPAGYVPVTVAPTPITHPRRC